MLPEQKAKAKELYGVLDDVIPVIYDYDHVRIEVIKQCAGVIVDQILLENESNDMSRQVVYNEFTSYTLQEFYEQVKEEINKL